MKTFSAEPFNESSSSNSAAPTRVPVAVSTPFQSTVPHPLATPFGHGSQIEGGQQHQHHDQGELRSSSQQPSNSVDSIRRNPFNSKSQFVATPTAPGELQWVQDANAAPAFASFQNQPQPNVTRTVRPPLPPLEFEPSQHNSSGVNDIHASSTSWPTGAVAAGGGVNRNIFMRTPEFQGSTGPHSTLLSATGSADTYVQSSTKQQSILRSPFANAQPIKQRGPNSMSEGSTTTAATRQREFSASVSPPDGATATPSFLLNDHIINAVVSSVAGNVGMSTRNVSQLQRMFPQSIITLRQYFSVSQNYVLSKLMNIMFPFLMSFIRVRRRSSADSRSPRSQFGTGSISVDSPTSGSDNNISTSSTPYDLYIPTMAFITYVLLVGLTRGKLDSFHPQLLTSTSTFACVLLFLEVLCFKAGFYLLAATASLDSIAILDVLALCGYKYVGLVVIVGCGLAFKDSYDFVYWLTFAYCAFCIFLFSLQALSKSSQRTESAADWGVKQPIHRPLLYFIWSIALAQVPLSWFLTPSWRSSLKQS